MSAAMRATHPGGPGVRSRRRVVGMRWIVTGVAALLTTLGVAGLGLLNEQQSRETLNAEVQTRLLLTARNLALSSSAPLLSEFPELTLHPLVKEMQGEQQEITILVVLDHNQVIQGHVDVEQLGLPFTELPGLEVLDGGPELRAGERLLGSETLLMAEAPVLHPGGEPIGRALVGQDRSYINDLIAARRARQMLLVALVLGMTLVLLLSLMSALLRPLDALRKGILRIGRGDLDTPLRIKGRTEFVTLAESVNEMAVELKSAQAEMVEKERLAHELSLAEEIQASLLPEGDLAVGDIGLFGAHRAAAEVGGDYYDFFRLESGKIALTIADVSGKGLVGCMIMSMLSALLRSHADRYASPRALLLALDAQLADTLKTGQFVTMFYGVLDPDTGELRYASAAHSPLLIRRAGGEVEWYGTRGIPLGAVSNAALAATLSDETVTLAEGDLLLQYTDGINEAFNAQGEQFELSRIEDCARSHAAAGGAALLHALEAGVRDWIGDGAPSDDETLLVVSRREQPAAAEAAGDPVLSQLALASSQGRHLGLQASHESLRSLEPWFSGCPGVAELDEDDRNLVLTALHEAAANVAEHSCGFDPTQVIDLWWYSPTGTLTGGYFLLRDRGRVFEPGERGPSDFSDPEVRLRGRGIGLDIIRGVTRRFDYFPATAEGNLTILAFAGSKNTRPKEPNHV